MTPTLGMHKARNPLMMMTGTPPFPTRTWAWTAFFSIQLKMVCVARYLLPPNTLAYTGGAASGAPVGAGVAPGTTAAPAQGTTPAAAGGVAGTLVSENPCRSHRIADAPIASSEGHAKKHVEQAAAERFQDADRAWEATKARKKAKIQGKARKRAQNKDAQLQAVAPVGTNIIRPRSRSSASRRLWIFHDINHQVYTGADMATMAKRGRLQEGESAATATVHGGGDPMRLARFLSSNAAPENNDASFSCGVERGPGFSEDSSARDNPNGPAFHLILPDPGEICTRQHPLSQGETVKYNDYRNPHRNKHDRDGFRRAEYNQHGVNRAGYVVDGKYRGHQHGLCVIVSYNGYHVPAQSETASGDNGCGPGMLIKRAAREQREQGRGKCAGTRGRGSIDAPDDDVDDNDDKPLQEFCLQVMASGKTIRKRRA
eukprot:jgi/Undpi1/10520/HiC_scaffold_29.g12970.m1